MWPFKWELSTSTFWLYCLCYRRRKFVFLHFSNFLGWKIHGGKSVNIHEFCLLTSIQDKLPCLHLVHFLCSSQYLMSVSDPAKAFPREGILSHYVLLMMFQGKMNYSLSYRILQLETCPESFLEHFHGDPLQKRWRVRLLQWSAVSSVRLYGGHHLSSWTGFSRGLRHQQWGKGTWRLGDFLKKQKRTTKTKLSRFTSFSRLLSYNAPECCFLQNVQNKNVAIYLCYYSFVHGPSLSCPSRTSFGKPFCLDEAYPLNGLSVLLLIYWDHREEQKTTQTLQKKNRQGTCKSIHELGLHSSFSSAKGLKSSSWG